MKQNFSLVAPFEPRLGHYFYEEWDAGANTGRNTWLATASGAGAGAGSGTPAANRPGILLLTTGTTATGYSLRTTGAGASHFFGGGQFVAETSLKFTALSTASEEFAFRGLMGDSTTGADHTDGVYFIYDRAVSGNYWVACTASNGVRTTTVLDGTAGNPTNAVVAGTWYRLTAAVNADGTSVVFQIDGVTVATHTTNIPTTSARLCGASLQIVKTVSVGSTGSTVDIDYYYLRQVFTTPR
jgi:hypothetical protein